MIELRILLASTALAICTAAPIAASDLGTPTGPVLLTVTGDLSVTNNQDAMVFDLAMLEKLGGTSFETETPWTEGLQTFEGVSLDVLLDALGVSEGNIKATAINNYAVDIPVTDAEKGGPMIAYRHNNQAMSVREKGPLWVVYPYDLNAAYQTEVVYSRSIWQLDRLDITP